MNRFKGAADTSRAFFMEPIASSQLGMLRPPCPCEPQFPFGQSRHRFNVMQWDSAMRVVSGSGGRPNGMAVGLHVAACWGGLLSCTFREAARQG